MIGDKRGLTLMELLVVLGIFSLAVMLTSGIFLLSNRAQRRVLAVTAGQADLRFALEAMVREVRTGRIDYDYYESSGGVGIPDHKLVVKSSSGQREEFYLETNPLYCPAGISQCLVLRLDGGTPQALTSAGITVDKLSFYLSPQADPFKINALTGAYGADSQPTVTIIMQARTTNVGAADIPTVNAQTTVTARTYVR